MRRFFRFLQPGLLRNLIFQARLVYHLMRDRRVSFFLKLIPLVSLAYLAHPDFLVLPIDDFIVVTLGLNWFIKLSPKWVVQEHTDRLKGNATVQTA